MNQRVLRLTRIIVSVFAFVALTLALTAPALAIPVVAPWLEKIQLIPALAGFSTLTFVIWLVVTLLFGRIYCSSVCPLGTLQDVAAWCPGLRNLRHGRYRYAQPRSKVRYLFLLVMLVCLMLENVVLVSILDPYGEFAGFCTRMFAPVVGQKNIADSEVMFALLPGTLLSVAVFCAVIVTAGKSGRAVCNTICPVGTALGLVSRYAVYHIEIDTDKCIHCGLCADACKGQCIDLKDHVVDGSRCVNCFSCLPVCPNDAIHYTSRRKQLSIPMMQQISMLLRPKNTALEGYNSNMDKTEKNETIS